MAFSCGDKFTLWSLVLSQSLDVEALSQIPGEFMFESAYVDVGDFQKADLRTLLSNCRLAMVIKLSLARVKLVFVTERW